MQIEEDKTHQQQLQDSGKFDELREYVKEYRHYDLRFVDISDFLIVVVDPTIPQWGTANEVYEAESEQKPRFVIIEGGMKKLPRWLFGVFESKDVFESLEALIEHLVKLDRGEIALDRRWVLVRKHLQEQRSRYS